MGGKIHRKVGKIAKNAKGELTTDVPGSEKIKSLEAQRSTKMEEREKYLN
jgi:hypothetical protein